MPKARSRPRKKTNARPAIPETRNAIANGWSPGNVCELSQQPVRNSPWSVSGQSPSLITGVLRRVVGHRLAASRNGCTASLARSPVAREKIRREKTFDFSFRVAPVFFVVGTTPIKLNPRLPFRELG